MLICVLSIYARLLKKQYLRKVTIPSFLLYLKLWTHQRKAANYITCNLIYISIYIDTRMLAYKHDYKSFRMKHLTSEFYALEILRKTIRHFPFYLNVERSVEGI